MKALMQEARTKTSWKQAHWFWVAAVAAVVLSFVIPLFDRTSLFAGFLSLVCLFAFFGSIVFARPETDYKRDVGMPRMQRPWYRYGLLGLAIYVLSRVLNLIFPSIRIIWDIINFAAVILWLVALKLWTDAHEIVDT